VVLFHHKTCKTNKTLLKRWESLPTGGFPAATRLRSRPNLKIGFEDFVGFVTLSYTLFFWCKVTQKILQDKLEFCIFAE